MIRIDDFFMNSIYQEKLTKARKQVEGIRDKIQDAYSAQLLRSFNAQLAESLKNYLAEEKLSQTSCARSLGVSQSEVSRLVHRKNIPSVSLLLRLRLLLGPGLRIEPEDSRLAAYGAGARVVRQAIYGQLEPIPTESDLGVIQAFLEAPREDRWSLNHFVSERSGLMGIPIGILTSLIENWAVPFELCREVIDG